MTTISDIQSQVLSRCDMAGSNYLDPDEALALINSSAAELHEILATKYGEDYALSEVIISLPDGYDILPLPSDFYKLAKLFVDIGNGHYTSVERFVSNDLDRHIHTNSPPSGANYKLWYIPRWTLATNITDELPDYFELNNWFEYVVIDVAIKLLTKQETDCTVFIEQKMAIVKRIDADAANRDASRTFYLSEPSDWNSYEYYTYPEIDYPASIHNVKYKLHGSQIKLMKFGRYC